MLSEILFETEGGTELLAIHKYEPISLRAIFVSFKLSPRNDATGKEERKVIERLLRARHFTYHEFLCPLRPSGLFRCHPPASKSQLARDTLYIYRG